MVKPESNLGKWDGRHTTVKPFADTVTYPLAAEWLTDCAKVEDWGAGSGYLSKFIEPERYVGVDGSPGPKTSVIADLVEYRSETPGLCLRHILEHNHEWAKVLDNALASFTERMALILFTPLAETTHNLGDEPGYPGVPCYAFNADDLLERIDASDAYPAKPVEYRRTSVAHGGIETIFYLENA